MAPLQGAVASWGQRPGALPRADERMRLRRVGCPPHRGGSSSAQGSALGDGTVDSPRPEEAELSVEMPGPRDGVNRVAPDQSAVGHGTRQFGSFAAGW